MGTCVQRTDSRAHRAATIWCGTPSSITPIPAGEVDMQTGRDMARRAAASRWAENEVTHTRSQAAVRSSTSASGRTAGTSLISTLNRMSGQAVSRSSKSGIGSVPPIRAAATRR